MSVVFDEVTGSVEPREAPAAAQPQEQPAAGAESSPKNEAQLEQWLRKRAWLQARRFAD